jgi:hypothetical protein
MNTGAAKTPRETMPKTSRAIRVTVIGELAVCLAFRLYDAWSPSIGVILTNQLAFTSRDMSWSRLNC